ncbi:hypothetical protein GCM10010331_15720 [Streptomyces xanthochromogenes]|uniref:hypothetical protein n=1 Tax=Streptomyces xanthochromogenes TaxID=67384 RepID=UPI0019C81341|nr:hypothetical protein [Streptomyces xanthochromogenes]GHB30194.1 hypothetical protein GCM10010331_15720 [Streptomyces xanthochromogenes]
MLHWADDPEGRGAASSGGIFMVVMDRRWVSFMYSIPNFIPERPGTIRRALTLGEPFAFVRVLWTRGQHRRSSSGHAAPPSAASVTCRIAAPTRTPDPKGRIADELGCVPALPPRPFHGKGEHRAVTRVRRTNIAAATDHYWSCTCYANAPLDSIC